MEQCDAPVGWLQPVQETSCASLSGGRHRTLLPTVLVSHSFRHPPCMLTENDSAAGWKSRICEVAVTECWPRALDSDLCFGITQP